MADMTPDEAKRIVREKWPDACVKNNLIIGNHRMHWIVSHGGFMPESVSGPGCERTEHAAWISAAKRIKSNG